MNKRYMERLEEKLCRELEEIAMKPGMSAVDLEAAHKLTDTIKNLCKISMLQGSDDYEEDDDIGYSSRRKHYVRGHYSRSDGSYDDGSDNLRRGENFRYSRAEGRENMLDKLHDMMEGASGEKERDVIRRCMKQLESV